MSNVVLETIQSLRSIHWDFNDKKVTNEDIETIVEHSMRCANSDNLVDYSVIVVDDPETLSIISGGESGGKAASCLVYCMDHTRIIQSANALGYEQFKPATKFYNFMIAMQDVCGAAQTAVIAAKSMGIDSLVTNFTHRNHPKEIRGLLGLPTEYCMPIISVVLGYSDKKMSETTGRLSKKHVIHYGKYQLAEQEQVSEIIAEMDAIYPHNISQKYPHCLDWYFSQWMIEHYEDAMHNELMEDFRKTKLLFPS